jgi:cytochrome c-type biogenesis protein CcmE
VALTRARPRSHSSRRLWLAGIVVLGAIGFLVFRGLGNSVVYFKTADEAVASRAQLGSRDFRIEGVVVPGSVRPTGNDVAFTIASKGVQVPVVNQGTAPQMFQPNVPVVLEGHFAGQQFLSDQIMVKHSAVYIGQHPGRVTAPDGSTR